jgi:outer membrane receptor protein involved in Fe transport
VCAEDDRGALEEIPPTVTLPTITVETRSPAFDSEERELNGVFRGLPGVILQTPGSRGTLSNLFVRGASAGLGQLSFNGVPLLGELTGVFNLSTVPVDVLERVEIVRGASGPRYGSRALGDIIRLQSRDAREDGGFLHPIGSRLPSRSTSAVRTSPTTVRPRSSASAPVAPRSSPGYGWIYDINPATKEFPLPYRHGPSTGHKSSAMSV